MLGNVNSVYYARKIGIWLRSISFFLFLLKKKKKISTCNYWQRGSFAIFPLLLPH